MPWRAGAFFLPVSRCKSERSQEKGIRTMRQAREAAQQAYYTRLNY
jgi:hypothetical protein